MIQQQQKAFFAQWYKFIKHCFGYLTITIIDSTLMKAKPVRKTEESFVTN